MPAYKTLVDLVDRLAHASEDDRLLLVDPRGRETSYSWPRLHRKIRRHADWLATQGVRAGDRVIVCPTSEPDIIASFLGLFYLGAIPLSVSGTQLGQAAGSQLDFIANLIEIGATKGVFSQQELVAGNDEVRRIDPELLIDPIPSTLDLEEDPPDIPPAQVDPDDLALVQFSSGSTSHPKGVRLTHANVLANLSVLADVTRRPDEVGMSWLPLYHDMGLMGVLLSSFWFPAREQIIMNPIRFLMKPIVWLDYLTRHEARVSVCPNFALDLCTDRITEKHLDDHAIDLSKLEQIFVGAEPVRPESLERFERKFKRWGLQDNVLRPVYGMAEATLIVTAPDHDEPITTRSVHGIEIPSVGKPLADFELRIVHRDGEDAKTGEIGEILLKGRSVTPGYLDSAADGELFTDGWLRTGDLGLLDEEGRLYVTGRIKDLIIIDGKNYYAHDIVAELERLPFLERGKVHVFAATIEGREQMAVLSVPLARMTPAVKAKIKEFQEFMRAGGPQGWLKRIPDHTLDDYVERLVSSDRQELVNDVKRYLLARFGVPVHDVVCVRRIPKTTSGKVKRDACEQIYFEQRKSG